MAASRVTRSGFDWVSIGDLSIACVYVQKMGVGPIDAGDI